MTLRRNRWRARAPMPTPRGALAAAVIDGKIHAVSGNGWRLRNTSAHEVYDPGADRWTARAAIPTPRDHLAVATVDGRLYAIGGRVNGSYDRNLNVNEAYDPRHRSLAARSRPFPRRAAASPRPCSAGAYSWSVARHRAAPFIRSRPTIPSRTAGPATRACRRRDTGWARRSTPGACT